MVRVWERRRMQASTYTPPTTATWSTPHQPVENWTPRSRTRLDIRMPALEQLEIYSDCYFVAPSSSFFFFFFFFCCCYSCRWFTQFAILLQRASISVELLDAFDLYSSFLFLGSNSITNCDSWNGKLNYFGFKCRFLWIYIYFYLEFMVIFEMEF